MQVLPGLPPGLDPVRVHGMLLLHPLVPQPVRREDGHVSDPVRLHPVPDAPDGDDGQGHGDSAARRRNPRDVGGYQQQLTNL